MTQVSKQHCTRCGEQLTGRIAWLELNNLTNLFCIPGTVDEQESQGLFPFGYTCAKQANEPMEV